MATTPNDAPHILQAKQAAVEQDLDLTTAFTALNLAGEFYQQELADTEKLRGHLKRVRKRLREIHGILADDNIPDAKKVKKIRFIANLLLPAPPPITQQEKSPAD